MRKFLAVLVTALFCSVAMAWPFLPSPLDTNNVAVTGTAQSITVPGTASGAGLKQVVVTNIGTQTVFFRCDGTTATVGNGMPVIAPSQFLMSLQNTVATCSVIAASTGSTFYLTLGSGE